MFLLFLTFSFSIKPEIVKAESLTDGLVGWWKFDDASGTTANDSSASNFDATLYNFPGDGSGWQDGILGGAVLFNDVLHNYAKTDNILVSNTENGSG